MSIFHQCGDPVTAAAACLCQHHGAAYCEFEGTVHAAYPQLTYDTFADGATIVQCQIVITERCCIAVNAATMTFSGDLPAVLEIERPIGTIRTTQEDTMISTDLQVFHHAAWEVLDPGTYTYFLVNRKGTPFNAFAAWIKIIASDCEG